jgi:quercetin dioxygenase-like cupin family protein
MVYLLAIVLLLCGNAIDTQQPPAATAKTAGAIYLPAKQLQEAVAQPGTRLADRGNSAVMFSERKAPGEAEWHESEADVIYVVDGAATLVTGGTIVDGKTTAPGEIRGTAIRGGQTFHLVKGDAIVIPKQTPHWYSAVDGSFKYFLVKIRE